MVHSIWFLTKISRILVWIKGAQRVHESMNMPPWVLPPVVHCDSKTYQWKRYIKFVCHCFKCNVVQEPKGLVKLYSTALTLTTQKSPLGVGLGLSHTHIPVTFIWEFPLPPASGIQPCRLLGGGHWILLSLFSRFHFTSLNSIIMSHLRKLLNSKLSGHF